MFAYYYHYYNNNYRLTLSSNAYGRSQSYLKGRMDLNLSLNLCWLTSNVALFRRMLATSLACSGATCCLTVMLIFLVLFHCSGNSCKQTNLKNNIKSGNDIRRHPHHLKLILKVSKRTLTQQLSRGKYWHDKTIHS